MSDLKRFDAIKFQGEAMTLVGPEVKVGDKATDFTAMCKAKILGSGPWPLFLHRP